MADREEEGYYVEFTMACDDVVHEDYDEDEWRSSFNYYAGADDEDYEIDYTTNRKNLDGMKVLVMKTHRMLRLSVLCTEC